MNEKAFDKLRESMLKFLSKILAFLYYSFNGSEAANLISSSSTVLHCQLSVSFVTLSDVCRSWAEQNRENSTETEKSQKLLYLLLNFPHPSRFLCQINFYLCECSTNNTRKWKSLHFCTEKGKCRIFFIIVFRPNRGRKARKILPSSELCCCCWTEKKVHSALV